MNYDMCDPNTNGEYHFLESIAKKLKFAFDIGANVGDYSIKLKSYNPDCRIIAFEPMPGFARRTRDLGIETYQIAVGEAAGVGIFYRNTRIPALSSFHLNNENTVPMPVTIQCVDDIIKRIPVQGPALMKIDTEGNDVPVLRGAHKTLAAGIFEYIQFEYGEHFKHAHEQLESAFDILMGHGYNVFHVNPDGLLSCPEFLPEYEVFRYSNWVAIKDK